MVSLYLGQIINLHQALASLCSFIRSANNLNNLVDIDDSHQQAFHQVQAIFALAQTVLSTATHYLNAVVRVDAQQIQQAKCLRLTIDQRHIIDAERIFKRSVLIQRSQHRVGIKTVLYLNNKAQPVLAIREILNIRDTHELLIINAVFNLLDDLFRANHVRQFGHHNATLASGHLFNADLRARLENTASGGIRILNTLGAHNDAARR